MYTPWNVKYANVQFMFIQKKNIKENTGKT